MQDMDMYLEMKNIKVILIKRIGMKEIQNLKENGNISINMNKLILS